MPDLMLDCRTCEHPVECHEAGECWFDRSTGADSDDPADRCPCDCYEPIALPVTA